MKKKPRRMFRGKRVLPLPTIPLEVWRLENARKVIDPMHTYFVQMPDGKIYTYTGAELIKTADVVLSVAKYLLAGDKDEMYRAMDRLDDIAKEE